MSILKLEDVSNAVIAHGTMQKSSWSVYKSTLNSVLKPLAFNKNTDLYTYINSPMELCQQLLNNNTSYQKAEDCFKTLLHCANVAHKHIDVEHTHINNDAYELLKNYKTNIIDVVYVDHPKLVKKSTKTVKSEQDLDAYDSDDTSSIPSIEEAEKQVANNTDVWKIIDEHNKKFVSMQNHIDLLQEIIEDLLESNHPNGVPTHLFKKVLRAASNQRLVNT